MSRISGSSLNPLIVLACEKASGTGGGTNTTGAWATREINVKNVDTAGICTLASNQFTLPPGRYKVQATSAHVQCDNSQLRLWSVTAGAAVALGVSDRVTTAAALGTILTLDGAFDLAAAQTLRLEYRTATVYAGGGLGLDSGWGVNVFAQITLEKVR